MSDPVEDIFEFAGKATGIIAKDLADVSKPLAAAYRRGWHRAWEEKPAAATPSPDPTRSTESA